MIFAYQIFTVQTQDAINAQSRLLQQAKKSWEDAAIAITLAEQTTRVSTSLLCEQP